MAEKLTFSGVPEPIEVDFLDHEFESAPVTRSVQKKAAPLSQKLLAEMFQTDTEGNLVQDEEGDPLLREDGGDDDKIIDILAKLLDLRLRSTNGTQTKPSTLVNRKWKADELDSRSLFEFWMAFRKAEQPEVDVPGVDQGDRPT